jgi:hypothetical protein
MRCRRAGSVAVLPAAFPEGFPTHPSYPAAHACNAGACATILKAFFDPDYLLPHPVEATAGRIGARALAWRRSHPRQRDRQAAVGEQQALGLLRDYSRTYNERLDGFIVRKFNGNRVKVASGEVHPL